MRVGMKMPKLKLPWLKPKPPPVVVVPPPTINFIDLIWAAAALISIVLLAVAVAFYLREQRMKKARAAFAADGSLPPSSKRVPPGRALNIINAFVHIPLVAAIVGSIFWASMCFAAALLAPAVLLDGLIQTIRALVAREVAPSDRERHAILVTGCDTGFGNELARDLLARGYTVFAACLNPASVSGLSSPRAYLLQMDVTSDEDVSSAVSAVSAWVDEKKGRRLLSVVNNAGIGTGGFVEQLTMRDFERDSAVNYLGVVRVCKAFLPLLRKAAMKKADDEDGGNAALATPRLLVVSSMSGKLPVPLLAPYSASKHAVACFAAALRMEVKMLGVDVVTILPSFHRTPLLTNRGAMLDRVWAQASKEVRQAYGALPNAKPKRGSIADTITSAITLSPLRAGSLITGGGDSSAVPQSPTHSSAKLCCEMFLTDWAWDPARVTEGLAREATRMRTWRREVAIGGDVLFGLNVLRHLPPTVYESVIYYWMAWHLVEPA